MRNIKYVFLINVYAHWISQWLLYIVTKNFVFALNTLLHFLCYCYKYTYSTERSKYLTLLIFGNNHTKTTVTMTPCHDPGILISFVYLYRFIILSVSQNNTCNCYIICHRSTDCSEREGNLLNSFFVRIAPSTVESLL